MNVLRYVRRAGALVALVASRALSQAPAPMQVGQSVWVKFFASGDTSETQVSRGRATWKKCGRKKVWGLFYTGPDSAHLTQIGGDSLAIPVPCPVVPPPMGPNPIPNPPGGFLLARSNTVDGALDTLRCAGVVSDTAVHLPFCSRPPSSVMFSRDTLGLCFANAGYQFSCADTVRVLAYTNIRPQPLSASARLTARRDAIARKKSADARKKSADKNAPRKKP